MSSFLAQGERKSVMRQKMQTNKHIKNFYKILNELDLVAQAMIKSGTIITEENIVEQAGLYTDRKIDTYEKNILLSKIGQVYRGLLDKQEEE